MKFPKHRFLTMAFTCAAVAAAQTVSPAGPGATPNPTATQGLPQLQPPTPAKPAPAPESTLPETTPVITIEGVCEITTNGTPKTAAKTPAHAAAGAKAVAAAGTAAKPAESDCKTQITRAEFEKLIKTVAPTAPAQARRQIATRYVQFLTAANEGVKLGVDKESDFTEQLAIMRLQLLAQDAERKLQTEASNVSEADIKSFYDQNPTAFDEVTLTRLFIPRTAVEAKPDAKSAEPTPDSKAIADNAREQLAGGGDPDKIQKSIFEQLKTTTEPPTTKFGARRRGSLPPGHEQKVFSLKQGEVSEVIPDSIGYVIYRVDGKEQLPFDKVKEEVKQKVTRQRIEDARQKITGASKADYNDAYFGPEIVPGKPGPAATPPSSRPPAPTLQNPPPNPK